MSWRGRVLLTLVSAAATLAALTTVASAAPVATAELQKHGTLVNGRQTAVVRVEVTCSGGDVLEAFVQLQQGRTSGQGGIPGIQCDGVTRTYTARVQAIDGPFKPGRASASAFVLVCDAESNCGQGQDNERVVLRPRR